MVTDKPNDAGPTSAWHNDSRAFLECVLARHVELGLDEQQFITLSRMYWHQSKRDGATDEIAAVAATLSPDQFCRAVASVSPLLAASNSALGLDTTVEKLVSEAVEKRTKDRQLVEVELATKVAERVMGWAKVFGFFVAAPVALGLIMLSAIGISKGNLEQYSLSAISVLAERAVAALVPR